MINSRIEKTLRDYNIYIPDGLCYLLSLHYGYEPSFIPHELKQKIHATNIITVNEKGVLEWKIPLFESQEGPFEWVKTEYVELFKSANPDKGGHAREATARMKKFFADYPEYRKEDIMEATRLYIRNTESRYLRLPHYFIEKGAGAAKTRDILEWLDKAELIRNAYDNRTSVTQKLQ